MGPQWQDKEDLASFPALLHFWILILLRADQPCDSWGGDVSQPWEKMLLPFSFPFDILCVCVPPLFCILLQYLIDSL